jgi:hypothetical protein
MSSRTLRGYAYPRFKTTGLEACSVRIWAGTSVILTEVFRDFPQSLEANSTSIRARQPCLKSFAALTHPLIRCFIVSVLNVFPKSVVTSRDATFTCKTGTWLAVAVTLCCSD